MDEIKKPRMSKLERTRQRLAELEAKDAEAKQRDLAYTLARERLKAAYNACGRADYSTALQSLAFAVPQLEFLAGGKPPDAPR